MMNTHPVSSRRCPARVLLLMGALALSAPVLAQPLAASPMPPVLPPGGLPSAPGAGYSGQRLSLNFQNIDVRSLLQVLADFTHFNVIVSDAVTGTLSLRLKDVPWDQALDIILQARNLGVRRNGSVLWIAPREEINAREKLDFESRAALENLEPVRTQSFQLHYAKAAVVAQSLAGGGIGAGLGAGLGVPAGPLGGARLLGPRGSVMAEPRTNQIFVTDAPTRLAQVADLISKLDVPVRQVMIEARIVEAADSFGQSLGVRLGGAAVFRRASLGTWPVLGANGMGAPGSGGQFAAPTLGNIVNLPAGSAGGTGQTPGAFTLALFNAAFSRLLNLEISALEADGKGKLISSPRVITADQSRALIEQGEEIPYQQATSSGATSVAFRKAVLKLEVTPQITPEGDIILTLDVSRDARGVNTTAGPAINTKHVQTEVLVENGGTVAIGGIFELTETSDEARIPVLGELPLVGALFRNRERVTHKTEMLIFITPHMISDRNARQ